MAGMNLKLQGQFKFDIYNSKKELISSSEYIDNFITNSGVMYPYHFTFADCFRYLSLGSGTAGNSIVKGNNETTGLQTPIPIYSYIGGRTSFNGGTNTTNYTQPGQFGAACGYIQNADGVTLVRSWTFPDNSGDAFTSTKTFGEFMVTPGRPYVSGADKNLLCSCNELASTNDATGLDCSATAEYYNWLSSKYLAINGIKRLKICDATKAFARVVPSPSITVNAGDILNVIYQLNIAIDTGIHFSSLVNGAGAGNWQGKLNSYNNITQPGVALINDGVVGNSFAPNNNQRLQHFDYTPGVSRLYVFENEYGESFVPPMGIPLEPSAPYFVNQLQNQSIVYYLSDNDIQFLVSASGGALVDSGDYRPWSPTSPTGVIYPLTSGLLPFINQNTQVLTSPSVYWSQNLNSYNIRMNQGTSPSTSDITLDNSTSSISFVATKTAQPLFSLLTNSSTGIRTGQIVYNSNFSNYTGASHLYAKSFVAAYRDIAFGVATYPGDTTNLIPFFDAVFSGTNTGFLPNLITGLLPPDSITGVQIDTSLSTNFNNLNNTSFSPYPLFNTILTWSVPCPYGVVGC